MNGSLTNKKSKIGALKRVKWIAWLLILPSLVLLYFLVWRPVLSGIFLSFFELKNYEPVKFVGMENYRRVVSDTLFLKTLSNTVKYVLWSLLFGYLTPVVLAVMLNELVHFKGIFKFSIYFPSIVPGAAVSLIWYFMYYPTEAGLLNALRSLVGMQPFVWLQNSAFTIPLIILSLTWQGCGGTMIMYLAALQGINQELYEATKIDGANAWQRIKTVTVPQIWPMMALYLVKQIIGIFQIMQEPLLMTGGEPNNASVSLALSAYRYAFVYFKPQNALAVGTITFMILIMLTFLYVGMNKKMES